MTLWESRESRILDAVASAESQGVEANNEWLEAATALTESEVALGLRALHDAGYLTGIDTTTMDGPSFYLMAVRLLERGRRSVGQWPSDDPAQLLIQVIEARIAAASTDDERSKLSELRDTVLGVGRDVLVSLLSTFAHQLAGLR